ncbi:MAG: MraY family glycosyltransferase [Erysipelotrichaceae bacterium]
MNYFINFLLPFALVLILTPALTRIALAKGWTAKVNERTVHKGLIPRVGGIIIYFAFMSGVLLFLDFSSQSMAYMLASSIMFFVGLYDDIFDMPALVKFLMQVIAAIIVIYFGGVIINTINLPFGLRIDNTFILGMISFVWIVGVTNAINLLDGLDGLATGISSIVLITAIVIAFSFTPQKNILMMLILLGSLLGFLKYNFYPASIFLGDCGSQFIGFVMGFLTLVSFKSSAFITLVIPFVILFIPLMDSVVAIFRRKLSGKSIVDADRSHLHHVLMIDLNLGHRKTVLVMYVVTAIFGFTAWLYHFDSSVGTIVLVFLILLYELFVEYTGMINKKYRPILNLVEKIIKKK